MSRLEKVLAAAAGACWAIQPEKLEAIAAILERRANGEILSEADIVARIGEASAPKASTARGIAVVPLFGVVAHRMNMMTEISGGTSTERFAAILDQLLADDSITGIVIDVDSPGGTVQGIEELAKKIYSARGKKPILAVANSLAASAAYWLATAADELWVIPSGEVGSIGVYAVYVDTSEMDAKDGVKVSVLKAGKYKAEGVYGPLDPEAEAAMQARIDEYYGMFVRAVARQRDVSVDAVRNGFGQGRVVGAKAALEAGMVDRIGTLDEAVASLGGGKVPARRSTARVLAPAALAATANTPAIPFSIHVEAPGSVSGDAAPVVVPVTSPAPEAKEHTMSAAEDVAAAAAAEQAKAAEKAQERLNALSALATEHPQQAALPRWIKEGVSVEAAKSEVMTQLKAELAGKTPIRTSQARVTGMDDPNEAKKPFANLGEQMVAVIGSARPGAAIDPRLLRINAAVTGSNEGVGSDGGFAVQEDFIPGIMEPVYATGEIAKRVTKLPVGPNANGVKFNVVDETSRANGSRWGGLSMAWAGEGVQGSNSKVKLRPVELNLKKLIGLMPLTDELLQDAVAMAALLEKGAQTELTFMVEDAVINGLGTGQPLGILNAGCTVQQAIEASQTIANSPASIVANVSKMKSRFPASLWGGAVWLANQELEPTFIQATLGGSSAAFPVYMPAGGLSGAPYATILGKPVVYVDYCAAVGTPGDLILTNLGEYAMIDKGGPQSASSIHLRFDFDETVFRITYRCDGQPIWKTAVTPYKGSLTRSPFVTLAVRS